MICVLIHNQDRIDVSCVGISYKGRACGTRLLYQTNIRSGCHELCDRIQILLWYLQMNESEADITWIIKMINNYKVSQFKQSQYSICRPAHKAIKNNIIWQSSATFVHDFMMNWEVYNLHATDLIYDLHLKWLLRYQTRAQNDRLFQPP